MMDVMPPVAAGTKLVERYGAGSFFVAGEEKHTSLVLHAEAVEEWRLKDFSALDEHVMEALCKQAKNVDILLIGSGETQGFLTPTLRDIARAYQLSVDCMDTGAACRTYNVLVGEGRRVMAALIII